MNEYLNLVENVLTTGGYKPNRTGVDTIASATPQHYDVDVNAQFPLLTTKKMDGFRWNSLIHELIWYLSGQHHIRDLREETQIWDAWADENHNLPTAYGRFWRRYPIPDDTAQLPGEWWIGENAAWIDEATERFDTTEQEIRQAIDRWVTEESDGGQTLDQIQYILDTLNGENPMRSANSRRLMVTPWNPANATVSHLPPCHAFWGVNVQGEQLNLHLTQRSGDIALGIPFNIAAYSLILKVLAAQTRFEPGVFSHTIIDAHIYAGKGKRGQWYANHLDEVQTKLSDAESQTEYTAVREWIEGTAALDDDSEESLDHVPGLLTQLTRDPKPHPTVDIADKPLDDLEFDDITLRDYESHDGLSFGVAE